MKKQKLSIIDEAKKILPKQFERPSEIRSFPENVSGLAGYELSNLHAHFTTWYSFIADALNKAKAEMTLLKHELDKTYRLEFLRIEAKTQKERELKAKSTKEYIELEQKFVEKQVFVEMLQGELETLDKMIMALRAEIKKRENLKYIEYED